MHIVTHCVYKVDSREVKGGETMKTLLLIDGPFFLKQKIKKKKLIIYSYSVYIYLQRQKLMSILWSTYFKK